MSEPLKGQPVQLRCNVNKREFVKLCGASFCALFLGNVFPRASQAQASKKGFVRTKISPYFTSLSGSEIQCELCPKRCQCFKG